MGDVRTPAHEALLRALVEQAVLAPSSHNTQPWRFRLDGDRLELHADRTRALPVNDPHDRELTISCGAALLGVRIAADHAGAALHVVVLPEGDGSDLLAVATVTGGGGGAEDDRLFSAIARRRTHRRDFAEREVPPDVQAELVRAAAAEGAGLQVLGSEARAGLVALVAEGDRRQFSDPRWRRELASWMHPRDRGEGLVVGPLAGPATRFVLRHVDVGRRTSRQDAELAERSPLLAVLTTPGDTVADWLVAGQALQRVLLTATAAGLQASYLNQPLQADGLRPRVAELLDGGRAPQLVLRLGHPREELPPAPRRPLAAVVELARG